jgi:hypothetical protein
VPGCLQKSALLHLTRLELHLSSSFPANLIQLYGVASELLSYWSVGSKHSILLLVNIVFYC